MQKFSVFVLSVAAIAAFSVSSVKADASIEKLESLKGKVTAAQVKPAKLDRQEILRALRKKGPKRLTKADRAYIDKDMDAHPQDYVHKTLVIQGLKTFDKSASVPDIGSARSAGGPLSRYDAEKAHRLAGIADANNAGAFGGRCYQYVAGFMEAAGVIRSEQWDELGISPFSAADFAYWANGNPDLLSQIKLEKFETPAAASAIPVGSIVVYDRGACGFSGKHGHIEVAVAENYLCSDGCESFDQACLDDTDTRAQINVYIPVK